MPGISRHTGQTITEQQHIRQSVEDIFTTPLGSRVRRRDYGFDFNLIDQPQNPETRLKLFVAAATALLRWEPRLSIQRLQFTPGQHRGTLTIYHAGGDFNVAVGAAR